MGIKHPEPVDQGSECAEQRAGKDLCFACHQLGQQRIQALVVLW